MVDIIKVSAKSRSTSVAGAIAGVIREHKHADVQAIGAGAVNQAVKALAIARGYLERDRLDIVCVPSFVAHGCQIRGRRTQHWRAPAARKCASASSSGVKPERLRARLFDAPRAQSGTEDARFC